MFELHEGHKTT